MHVQKREQKIQSVNTIVMICHYSHELERNVTEKDVPGLQLSACQHIR